MTQLLRLPAEVLASIVELILVNEQPAPGSIEEARRNRLDVNPQETAKDDRNCVVYGRSRIMSNGGPLLRACRLLGEHTRRAMGRLFPDGPKYKLDVMLVDGGELWLTWLCVPFLSERVRSLDVTFRVFSADTPRSSAFASFPSSGLRSLSWSCVFFIEHFLACGPYPSTSDESLEVGRRRRLAVKEIALCFRAAHPASLILDDDDISHQHIGNHSPTEPLNHSRFVDLGSIVYPRWLSGIIWESFDDILHEKLPSERWASMLFGRVERFHKSASVESPWDATLVVHDILESHQVVPDDWPPSLSATVSDTATFDLGSVCRALVFWNWKWATLQERRGLGLIVPEDPVLPSLETWLRWRDNQNRTKNYNQEQCRCAPTELEEWLKAQAAKKNEYVKELGPT
jgi:hypothetical protein